MDLYAIVVGMLLVAVVVVVMVVKVVVNRHRDLGTVLILMMLMVRMLVLWRVPYVVVRFDRDRMICGMHLMLECVVLLVVVPVLVLVVLPVVRCFCGRYVLMLLCRRRRKVLSLLVPHC